MAKAKRMSDIFASSAEKSANAMTTAATPPYSSEGPTLPIIEGTGMNTAEHNLNGPQATISNANGNAAKKKRKSGEPNGEGVAAKQAQPIATIHPALYEPWTLLPREVVGLLLAQGRLASAQNVVPVTFTKNQNIKGGIIKLTTYLKAHVDQKNPVELPEALKEKACIIAISAQGEGTTKLVTIVDMAKRIVRPKTTHTDGDGMIETWWMYTSLTSIEAEQKKTTASGCDAHVKIGEATQETQEEEAFEPMEVDVQEQRKDEVPPRIRKVPVMTVWMTQKKVPAFKDAFGEQTFMVQTLSQDD